MMRHLFKCGATATALIWNLDAESQLKIGLQDENFADAGAGEWSRQLKTFHTKCITQVTNYFLLFSDSCNRMEPKTKNFLTLGWQHLLHFYSTRKTFLLLSDHHYLFWFYDLIKSSKIRKVERTFLTFFPGGKKFWNVADLWRKKLPFWLCKTSAKSKMALKDT